MGYDMRMHEAPEVTLQDQAAARELRAEANKLSDELSLETLRLRKAGGTFPPDYKEREQEIERLYDDAGELADPGYFRLNSAGMRRYIDAMEALGMVHPCPDPVRQDEWPKYPVDDDSDAAEEAYEAALEPLLVRHGDDPRPTIPSFKFGTNDGWHVTPGEIHAALENWAIAEDALDMLDVTTLDVATSDYWRKWISFLRRAEEHGGFHVR